MVMQTSEVEVELAPLYVGFLNLINVPPKFGHEHMHINYLFSRSEDNFSLSLEVLYKTIRYLMVQT